MKKRSGEKHHIKPRSLFPQLAKDKDNLIKLTYREHYICHWLLTKIYPSKEMTIAFWLFHSLNKNKGYKNCLAYEKSREAWCKLNGEIHHLYGNKNGMYGKRGKLNPNFGIKLSDESKKRQSEAQQKIYEDPERHRIQKEAVKKGNITKKFISDNFFRIRCIERNETFSSIREASRKLNINRGVISYSLKNNISYKGMTFVPISKEEYAETKTNYKI